MTVLTAALDECRRGRWGLFGQNDHLFKLESRADELMRMGESIRKLRTDLGITEGFYPYERFLHYRSVRGPDVPGEPKLCCGRWGCPNCRIRLAGSDNEVRYRHFTCRNELPTGPILLLAHGRPPTNRFASSLFAAFLVGVTFASPQDGEAPFSISISTAQQFFKAGSEVRIRLVFKNTSGEEISYGRGPGIGVEPQGELFSDIEVRDAKGELMPETGYFRVIWGRVDISANPATPPKSATAPATSVRPEP